MLRSTSVKNDSWKPVKLLARQTLDSPIIDSSCSSNGDLVAVLTDSNINIFSNRELIETVELESGKSIHVTEDANSIFVLAFEKLVCYNSWGKIKWESKEVDDSSNFSVSKSGEVIISKKSNLQILDRFGDLMSEIVLDSDILSISQSGKNVVALTDNTLNIFQNPDHINNVEAKNYTNIFCSEDSIMATSKDKLTSFSYSGSELWSKDFEVKNFSFSNQGIKHIFIRDSKNLVSQDRNGDVLWEYHSRENFDGATVLYSGQMVGIFSNQAFHVVDNTGQQAWSYQAREKIVNFSFSNHGGDIVIASESKIHWFQNEGFLRLQIEDALTEVENLFEKVSVYDSNLELVDYDIQKAKSLKSGNFTSIKKSFHLTSEVHQRLSMLQQRHVGYLDSLPLFLDNLGLRGAQTDEMIPLLYPYYSFHSDLHDYSYLNSSIQMAENALTKLDRIDISQIETSNLNTENNQAFIKEAKLGIESETNNLINLLDNTKKDIVSLEKNVKDLILDWLKTARLDSEPRTFLSTYQKSAEIRHSKIKIIKDKIDNHMAFVDYKSEQEFLVLGSHYFSASDKVNLNLNIKNTSTQKIDNIYLRSKVYGSGLTLLDPSSGVIRLGHLRAGESFSPIFYFNPLNNNLTKVALVLQYQDESGRFHTNWLGEIESNFLGCHISPYEIGPEEHDSLRLKYKDSNSHSVINVEGLSMKKIVNISKDLNGLHLCISKIENTRSILYHSGKSTLDDSHYLSMIFLRTVGTEDSLRIAIELICHAENSESATELKEEIISYLKTKLLESNGRLV